MKRSKGSQACDLCRKRKKRCSGTKPCSSCVRRKCSCVYESHQGDGLKFRDGLAKHLRKFRRDGVDTTQLPKSIPFTTPQKRSALVQHDPLSLDSTESDFREPRAENHSCATAWTADMLPDEDPAGNIVEPTSHYSWLYKVAHKLGMATQTSYETVSDDTSLSHGILSYGDAVLNESSTTNGNSALDSFSWSSICLISDTYFDQAAVSYRFLHRPSVLNWFASIHKQPCGILKTSQYAICLLVLSHGGLYLGSDEWQRLTTCEKSILKSEELLIKASTALQSEKGRPSIESVQARLAHVHHLLSSSRPNQAWYVFGTTVQLALVLGLHRDFLLSQGSIIDRELRRRTFWSVYATDRYVSISLGRPYLIQDGIVSQQLPAPINDENLGLPSSAPVVGECLLSASIAHASLARIISRGIAEYYEFNMVDLMQAIEVNRQALEDWRCQLPAVLSGVVHPTSLTPTFRRQAVVVNTFYLHAVILINRPALFRPIPTGQYATMARIEKSVVDASTKLANQIICFTAKERAEVYWFTQSITFNAISILYFHIINSLQAQAPLDDDASFLLQTARSAQDALARVSKKNAPSMRYVRILKELHSEVQQRISASDHIDSLMLPPGATQGGAVEPQPLRSPAQNTGAFGEVAFLPGVEDSLGSFWSWFDSLQNSYTDWPDSSYFSGQDLCIGGP